MTSPSTYSDEDLLDSINTTQAELDSLPEKEPPNAELCFVHGEQVPAEEVWVITYPEALQQVREHAESNLNSELGGALLGKAYRYKGVVFVDVMAAIPVTSADHGPIHFTFSADAWPQIQNDRNVHYPDLDIVGWFHTHPDLGVFYSSDDVVVHSAAFTLPWHVGLVVDPVRNEACFFGWVNGRLKAFSGFFERFEEGQENSTIPWRAVQTRVWDIPYDYNSHQLVSGGTQPYDNTYPVVTPSELDMLRSWAGLGFGLFGLLLAMGLFLGGIRPLQNQVTELESAVVFLANESLDARGGLVTCPDDGLRIFYPPHDYEVNKGEILTILGTAVNPQAFRYELKVRRDTEDPNMEWSVENELRRAVEFGAIATINTSTWPANADYIIRLDAVDIDRNQIIGTEGCEIVIHIKSDASIQGPIEETGTDNNE